MSDRNDLLPELLSEEFAELRWRRDAEDRLVNWMIAICGGVLTASVAVAGSAAPLVLFVFCVFAATLIVGVAWRIIEKLEAEARVYRHIGETISTILSNDHRISAEKGAPPYVGEHVHKMGKGDGGTARTVEIIRFTATLSATAIAVLWLVAFYVSCVEKRPNQSLEPTPTSVTPRADARVAPAAVVAHL